MPISTGATPGSSTTDWSAASADTYNATGFLPPSIASRGNKIDLTKISGDQLLQVLTALATNGDPAWGNIRYQLVKTGSYSGTPNFNINWGPDDISAVKVFVTKLHNRNAVYDEKLPITNFALQQQKLVKNDGINAGAKAPVAVSASADLESAAQTAFQKTLLRDATPEEAKKFAKDFQDLVLAYGDGKKSPISKKFQTPAQPVAFEVNGAPQEKPMAVKPTTALEQPPSASVAGANFAANMNPTESSAASAVNGLNEFLGMLKG